MMHRFTPKHLFRLLHHQASTDSVISRLTPHPNVRQHVPVMAREVIDMFAPTHRQKFLDLTYGAGGHSARLLNSAEGVQVYGLDRDPVAYEMAIQAASHSPGLVPLFGKFSELPELLSGNMAKYNNQFDGILIDCGCSSMQFDTPERGFSISRDGPLDMRMNPGSSSNQPTASEILSYIEEESLARVLKNYGEEKQAKKIARAIVESRYLFRSLKTTGELARLIEMAVGFDSRQDKLQRSSHVATKTFQALRILVNDELNELDFAMQFARRALKIGGRIVTLTFHSLEDRVVKQHLHGVDCPDGDEDPNKFKNYSREVDASDLELIKLRNWEAINKHVLTPSPEEVVSNPRSRSAKLRAAIRLR